MLRIKSSCISENADTGAKPCPLAELIHENQLRLLLYHGHSFEQKSQANSSMVSGMPVDLQLRETAVPIMVIGL